MDGVKSYEDGLRDGKILSLEKRMKVTDDRIDAHDKRLRLLERFVWLAAGVTLAVQLGPDFIDTLKALVGS